MHATSDTWCGRVACNASIYMCTVSRQVVVAWVIHGGSTRQELTVQLYGLYNGHPVGGLRRGEHYSCRATRVTRAPQPLRVTVERLYGCTDREPSRIEQVITNLLAVV